MNLRQTIQVLVAGALLGIAPPVSAQNFSALAHMDVAQSGATDGFWNTEIELHLSQPVPYRVFTLDSPLRLVLDFKEVDFRGVDSTIFTRSDLFENARFGGLRPGWSRMIFDLTEPVKVETAGMAVNTIDGTAEIEIVLSGTTEDAFIETAGLPSSTEWAFEIEDVASALPVKPDDGLTIIMIDPGHGGIDPGAEQGGVHEADVMLALGLELSAALGRIEGVQPALTRTEDRFVPLPERMTLARRAGADLFISLHADALDGEQATGASVYTLTDTATDAASQRMVERHSQGDLLAGIDLTGQADEIANILQDLVRVETAASGDRFADQLVQALQDVGAELNSQPRRDASLAVLNAADFPSILIEVGFLSNPIDRARLTSAQGRAPIVAGVTLAVGRWLVEEASLAPLIRQ